MTKLAALALVLSTLTLSGCGGMCGWFEDKCNSLCGVEMQPGE